MWITSFKLLEGTAIEARAGTLTATWDDPPFTYSEQCCADDKNVMDRAEIALKNFIERQNLEIEIN
jgi:hypothetical protein